MDASGRRFFYQRLPKALLVEAISEAKVLLAGGTLAKLTKAKAVRVAAKALTGSGWLPEPLKTWPSVVAA